MDKAKTWAILALAAMFLALCAGAMGLGNTASETVQQFAPIPRATADIALQRRQQEAQVTATYIAVLKNEVVSDTMTTHRLQREQEQADHDRAQAMAETWTTVKQVMVVGVGASVTFISAWFALAVIIALACYAWERYKRAQAFTPYQTLPDRALFWPEWNMLTDPRTGRQVGLRTEYPAQLDHGQLLIERQIAAHKPGMIETMGDTITRAMGAIGRYRVRVRNGERHPETTREIIEA